MYSNIRIIKYITYFNLPFLLLSCSDETVKKEKAVFENREWAREQPFTAKFRIEKPTRVQIYAYIETDPEVYKFCNLYVKYSLKNTRGDTIVSEVKEFFLSDPQTGEVYGKKSGKYCTITCSLTENHNFEPGTYTAELRQYMREDPIKGPVSVEMVIQETAIP